MKLATFLLSLITPDTPTSNGTVSLTLPLSRMEISEVLELSPETISRTLSSFRREQLIVARGRHLVIQNRAALESVAHR
jgi:CRP-like cAMP-binding protein